MASSTSAVAAARTTTRPRKRSGRWTPRATAGPSARQCRKAATPTAWWRWMACSTWSGATVKPAASWSTTRPATRGRPAPRCRFSATTLPRWRPAAGSGRSVGGRPRVSRTASTSTTRPPTPGRPVPRCPRRPAPRRRACWGASSSSPAARRPARTAGWWTRTGSWTRPTGAGAQWRPLAPPPLAVHGAQGAVVDGRFMIAAGASQYGQFSRFAWSGLLQAYTP